MANQPKSNYPVPVGELHQADIQRGKRLRAFRMAMKSEAVSMREMAEMISRKGYPCSQERYRSWELGHNLPGRAAAALFKMGMDLNWLYTGKKTTKTRKLRDIDTY